MMILYSSDLQKTQVNDDTLIDFGSDSVLLLNVLVDSLDEDDYVF